MVIADQIRKEADNTGPRVELEYWRRRMITFNTIFEEMNKHNCKIVFGILSTFNCPLVKVRYYIIFDFVNFIISKKRSKRLSLSFRNFCCLFTVHYCSQKVFL